MTRKMKRAKALFLFLTFLAGVPAFAADAGLCQRGEYKFTIGSNGANELKASVTTSTGGYKVTLFQSPELIMPPKVYFFCKKPTGQVTDALVQHVVRLRTAFQQLMLVDAAGAQIINASTDGPMLMSSNAPSAKSCVADDECGSGEFCDTTPKCTDGTTQGVCVKKPQFCPQVFEPVIACDGKTYSNTCFAKMEGRSVPGGAKTKLLVGEGVFPIPLRASKGGPGDAWPWNCTSGREQGDTLPWTCVTPKGQKKKGK